MSSPNFNWKEYEIGGLDSNGNLIDSIHARSEDYIIYFCKTRPEPVQPARSFALQLSKSRSVSNLYYECNQTILRATGVSNLQLAIINRLVSDNEGRRREILEQAGDALEMVFCSQVDEGNSILKEIAGQLVITREKDGQLSYQGAALIMAAPIWILYCIGCCLIPKLFSFQNPNWFADLVACMAGGEQSPWLLAAALGATGGVFSVCLNLNTIKVDVNQSKSFLWYAGATRVFIAAIAGIACYLGIQGKVILEFARAPEVEKVIGVTTNTVSGSINAISGGPTSIHAEEAPMIAMGQVTQTMLFFFFLAGFSETFIPNVLRNQEGKSLGAGDVPSPNALPVPSTTVPPKDNQSAS